MDPNNKEVSDRSKSRESTRFKLPVLDEKSCEICSVDFDEGVEPPVVLKCGHVFGLRCISTWCLQTTGTSKCPVCRESPYMGKQSTTTGVQPIAAQEIASQSATPGPTLHPLPATPARQANQTSQGHQIVSLGTTLWNQASTAPDRGSTLARFSISNYHTHVPRKAIIAMLLVKLNKVPLSWLAARLELSYTKFLNDQLDILRAGLMANMDAQHHSAQYGRATQELLAYLPASRDRHTSVSKKELAEIMIKAVLVRSPQIHLSSFSDRIRLGEWLSHPNPGVSGFASAIELQAARLIAGLKEIQNNIGPGDTAERSFTTTALAHEFKKAVRGGTWAVCDNRLRISTMGSDGGYTMDLAPMIL